MNVVIIYVIPVVGVVLAVAGTWYARWSGGPAVREERRQRSRESFRDVRLWMHEPDHARQVVAAAHRVHADLLAAAPMNPVYHRPGVGPDRAARPERADGDAGGRGRRPARCRGVLRAASWVLAAGRRRQAGRPLPRGSHPVRHPARPMVQRAELPAARHRAALVDYARESPFRELDQARRDGRVRPYLLDIGFDPVSWKAGLRLVCVFDEDAYLDIFRGMLADGDEGRLEVSSLVRMSDEPLDGMPFDEETVRGYLKAPTITEAARLCLGLTWEHRAKLGLS